MKHGPLHVKYIRCICTLALFLPVRTISATGCVLDTSLYTVPHSTLCLEDLTCIAKYSVRCYQIVLRGRQDSRPARCASQWHSPHTHIAGHHRNVPRNKPPTPNTYKQLQDRWFYILLGCDKSGVQSSPWAQFHVFQAR